MSLQVTILDKKIDKKEDAFAFLADTEVKLNLIAEVVRSELMNLRGGNAHTKTRAEVRGGGKKPWKQKGTGRARHGSRRSPIWVGGGITFGPRNTVNWHCKINKSTKISALKSVLKDRLVSEGVFKFVEGFDFMKTKQAVDVLTSLSEKTNNKTKKMLIIYTSAEKELLNGFPNTDVKMINVNNLKIHTLANATNYIFTPEAKKALEERLSK